MQGRQARLFNDLDERYDYVDALINQITYDLYEKNGRCNIDEVLIACYEKGVFAEALDQMTENTPNTRYYPEILQSFQQQAQDFRAKADAFNEMARKLEEKMQELDAGEVPKRSMP